MFKRQYSQREGSNNTWPARSARGCDSHRLCQESQMPNGVGMPSLEFVLQCELKQVMGFVCSKAGLAAAVWTAVRLGEAAAAAAKLVIAWSARFQVWSQPQAFSLAP